MTRFTRSIAAVAVVTLMAGAPSAAPADADTCQLTSKRTGPNLPTDLPERLEGEMGVDARKDLFLETLLPVVRSVNAEIRDRRARVAATLNDPDNDIPDAVLQTYGVSDDDKRAILNRIHTIPASLMLAQAILETGWGRSDFAQEGNALFGEHTQNPEIGMHPSGYAEGAAPFYVRAFDTLRASVQSYASKLNADGIYQGFRDRRQKMRANPQNTPDHEGVILTAHLDAYATDADYGAKLRRVIRHNDLTAYTCTQPLDQDVTQTAAR